jgi:hypothetical protein
VNAISTLEPVIGPRPLVLRPQPVVAILITLETRGASPLLAVDARAGDAVAERLRHLHSPERRVLAWAVLPDTASCLVTASGGEAVARLVSHVVSTTTDDLLRLGHEQVWRWPVDVMPVRPDQDLAGLVRYVLRTPERAGLVDRWREWRWAGSCHWSDPEPVLDASLAAGLLWLDALTGDG